MRGLLALLCVVLAVTTVGLGGCGGDSFTATPTGNAGAGGGEGAVSGGGNSTGGNGVGGGTGGTGVGGGSTGCVPVTCEALGAGCGRHADGCGSVVECGGCNGEQCLNDGVKWACSCTPKTCAQLGATCGLQDDGCGGPIACGNCDAPTVCAGKTCECPFPPVSCTAAGVQCGEQVDLCGRKLNCGTCAPGTYCGGGEPPTPGKCGNTVCAPKGCEDLGADCGQINDGCGNVVNCPQCPAGKTCGGGPVGQQRSNVCGCTPKTCGEVLSTTVQCGKFDDGCGGTLDCTNTCKDPETCQANNKCACVPKFTEAGCKAAGYECKSAFNGCGTVDCGACASGDCQAVYDATGTQTGSKCVADCKPMSCDDWYSKFKAEGLEFCGVTTDGCGNTMDCSRDYTCMAPNSCGGGGRANACGCTPLDAKRVCDGTCEKGSDGCGGNYDCAELCGKDGGLCNPDTAACIPSCSGQICGKYESCCNGKCQLGTLVCIGLPAPI